MLKNTKIAKIFITVHEIMKKPLLSVVSLNNHLSMPMNYIEVDFSGHFWKNIALKFFPPILSFLSLKTYDCFPTWFVLRIQLIPILPASEIVQGPFSPPVLSTTHKDSAIASWFLLVLPSLFLSEGEKKQRRFKMQIELATSCARHTWYFDFVPQVCQPW